MMFGFFFVIVLVGLGLWWLMQQQQGGGQNPFQPRHDDPVDIARIRYARGEITKEQYDEIRRTLGA